MEISSMHNPLVDKGTQTDPEDLKPQPNPDTPITPIPDVPEEYALPDEKVEVIKSMIMRALGITDDLTYSRIFSFPTKSAFQIYFSDPNNDFRSLDIALIGDKIFYFKGQYFQFTEWDLQKELEKLKEKDKEVDGTNKSIKEEIEKLKREVDYLRKNVITNVDIAKMSDIDDLFKFKEGQPCE